MNVYIDTDAVVAWEKGEFDLERWIRNRPNDQFSLPATVWQELLFGMFAWEPNRAQKRLRYLSVIDLPVTPFHRRHAARAAQISADLRRATIGLADSQIAACALEDDAELLSLNTEHFSRVAGLRLATV